MSIFVKCLRNRMVRTLIGFKNTCSSLRIPSEKCYKIQSQRKGHNPESDIRPRVQFLLSGTHMIHIGQFFFSFQFSFDYQSNLFTILHVNSTIKFKYNDKIQYIKACRTTHLIKEKYFTIYRIVYGVD